MSSLRSSLTALAAATALGTTVFYSSALALEETPSPHPAADASQPAEAADLPVWVLLDTTGELTPTAPAYFLNKSGELTTSKEPTDEQIDLWGHLEDFILAHEDIYADVSFSPDYSALELKVKEGTGGENNPELVELINGTSLADQVHASLVPFSLADLQQAYTEVDQLLADFPGYWGSFPLPGEGVLAVTIFAPDGTGASFEELQRQLATRADSPTASVPILVEFSDSEQSLSEYFIEELSSEES